MRRPKKVFGVGMRDAKGELVAAAPCYLKLNSYGKFVFDWSCARRSAISWNASAMVCETI